MSEDEYSDLLHALLPLTKDGERAVQYRARVQVELSRALFQADCIRRLVEGEQRKCQSF